MSIATYLTALDRDRDNLAANLTTMGVPASSSETFTSLVPKVLDIPSGSSAVPKKDVNFYDYDGTVVASYTAAEFAELTEMPANPSHEGLTAQGWNWSLADAKTYVATYSKLNIGQMYITSDGKTRLYISLQEGRTSPILQLYLNSGAELDIDWGDGSVHSTFTGVSYDFKSERHYYPTSGDYIITITPVIGSFELRSSESTDGSNSISSTLWNGNDVKNSPDIAYNNAIKKVEVGERAGIGSRAFAGCNSLLSITIPSSVTNLGGIDGYVFWNCYSLSSITIPSGVTIIKKGLFYICGALSSVAIPSRVTSIGNYAFTHCHALSSITIPSRVTTLGGYAFQYCYSLSSITIPGSVTNITGYTFDTCYSLSSITIPSSVTTIGGSTFLHCYSLATITINKASGSISGSPWGAITSSPTNTHISWTG